MENSRKFSVWFVTINALMILPNMCFVLLNAANTKIGKNNMSVRCRIPFLEDAWTDQQIKNLTQPRDMPNTCNFYDYNYGKFTSFNYTEALEYAPEVKNSSVVKCTDFVISNAKYYTVFEEFSMVCDKVFLEGMLNIAPAYGLFFSCAITPLADIFGRKRVIDWGTKLFFLAGLLIPTSYGPFGLIIGSFVTGLAYLTMQIPIQALVVELSNDDNRPHRFVILNIGTAVGLILLSGITIVIGHWRFIQLAASVLLLLLPILAWYVPESPVWFHSKYGKEKTWPVLKTLKSPGLQTDVLLYYRNEKAHFETALQNWMDLKQMKMRKFWCIVAMFFVLGAICFTNYSRKYDFVAYKSRRGRLIFSGITELLSCAIAFSLLFFFPRSLAIGLSFAISGVFYFVIPNLEKHTWYSLMLYMMTEANTSSAYITTSLYAAEFWAASNRCTMLSLVNGIAAFATIIVYYICCNVAMNAVLYASGALCVVAVVLIYYANDEKKMF